MRSKLLLGLLVYGVVPIIIIVLLFVWNIFFGFGGILAYLLLIIFINRTGLYQMIGNLEYRKGNLQKTAEWFGKSANSKKAGTNIIVNYGFVLLKSGRLDEAEKVLQSAVEKSNDRDGKNLAKSNLALVIWKKGGLDDAISMLEGVVSEYKTTAVYGSLGYMVIEKGDLDKALKINLEAYEYNDDNAIIQDNLAHLHHLRGEMDRAGEIFKKLMGKAPHFPEAYYDYAQYLEDEGKARKAAGMYRKALSCPFSFTSTITKEQVQNRYERLVSENPDEAADI